jgi:glutaredoxin 3
MNSKPIIYIKRGCPWCNDALEYFAKAKIELDIRDVNSSAQDMQRMMKLTGQSLTPCFEYGDFVVADFSVQEFIVALEKNPAAKKKLGL